MKPTLSESDSDYEANTEPASVMKTIELEGSKWIEYKLDERGAKWILAYVTDVSYDPESIFMWARLSQVKPKNNEFAFSDYKKATNVWIPQRVPISQIESIRLLCNQTRDASQFVFDPTRIYRAAGDRQVEYGDGGSSDLDYPIWYCNQPNIDNQVRTELLHDFLQLNEKRKDYQEVTPVQDIIDPDLGPCRTDTTYYTRTLSRLNQLKAEGHDGARRGLKELTREDPDYYQNKISQAVQVRETYHWLPSNFLVTSERKVRILSRIHNLPPRLKYAKMYDNIAKIFEGMVPMFENLNIINKFSDTNLQVIVKAQSYCLLPGMTYAGRWHVEGQTENIVAVGVYYLQVDDCLVGGKLKFRPADSPQPFYDIQTDVELDVKQGSAVVFSNLLPHRFRKIVNNSNEIKRRTFLNFFIVDPTKPLKSTKEVPSTIFLSRMVSKAAQNEGKQLPKPIIHHILSYLPNVWVNKTEAKRFRKTARDSMKTDTSGWGWINWGNCGTVEFVPAYSTWESRRRDECSKLQHTESDTPTSDE